MKMIQRFLGALSVAASVAFAAPAFAASHDPSAAQQLAFTSSVRLFRTAAAAQRHCPNDQVVWLNTDTGIYHEAGMRWYGRTRHGAFVCRRAANAAGDRDTHNGQ